MDSDLFLAILAMDSYNRGSGQGLTVQLDMGGGPGIGEATLLSVPLPASFQGAGFFAQSYSLNGQTIVSFRGTDFTPTSEAELDVVHGWWGAIDDGADQIEMAGIYYNSLLQVLGPTANPQAITLTGHSLGGGLAGYIGALNGVDSVLFDYMPFGYSALQTSSAAQINLPRGYFTTGEILTYVRNGDIPDFDLSAGQYFGLAVGGAILSPLLAALAVDEVSIAHDDSGVQKTGFNLSPNAGLGPIDLHSMALAVILTYGVSSAAPPGGYGTDGFGDIIKALYDTGATSIGQALDLGQMAGQAAPEAKLLTEIAYSAIQSGVRPFGDTAVHALYDDANDLQQALNHGATALLTDTTAAISQLVAGFVGGLAVQAVTNDASSHAFDGVLTSLSGGAALAVDLGNPLWKAGAPQIGHTALVNRAMSELGADFTQALDFIGAGGQLVDRVVLNAGDTAAHYSLADRAAPDGHVSLGLGGAGADQITGSNTGDLLHLGGGADTAAGGDGADLLFGGDGDDTLNGDDGNDTLVGGDGADTLYGGAGDDLLQGGGGGDHYVWRLGDGSDVIDDASGHDVLEIDFLGNGMGLANIITTQSGSDMVLHIGGETLTIRNGYGAGQIEEIKIAGQHPPPDTSQGDQTGFPTTGRDVFSAQDTLVVAGLLFLPDPASNSGYSGYYQAELIEFQTDPYGAPGARWSLTGANGQGFGAVWTLRNYGAQYGDVDVSQGTFFTGSGVGHGGVFGYTADLGAGAGDDILYGGYGYDLIAGGAGADLLYANAGGGMLWGDAGNDELYGGWTTIDEFGNLLSGASELYGGAGNDRLEGHGGSILSGGDGDDLIIGDFVGTYSPDADDTRDMVSFYDRLPNYYSASLGINVDLSLTGAQNTLQGFDTILGVANAIGSQFDDTLKGSDSGNWLYGREGADHISGMDGNDQLRGEDGDDTLDGGQGDDVLDAGLGADWLYGGDGFDTLSTAVGNSRDYPAPDGDDHLYGGDGQDALYAGAGNDVVYGGAGYDLIVTLDYQSDTSGGFVDLSVGGNDLVYGGDGNDVIYAGYGADTYDGGDGVDTLYYSSLGYANFTGLTIDLTLTGPQQTGFGLQTIRGIENLIGGVGDDTLIGNDADNFLMGNDGDDAMIGGGGNDTFQSGESRSTRGYGTDQVYGGDGDDVMFYQGGSLVFDGGAGIDTLKVMTSSGSTFNIADLEIFVGNVGSDIVASNDDVIVDQSMSGGGGSDRLWGGGGNDVLDGGTGFDMLYGGPGDDVLHTGLASGNGADSLFGGDGDDRLLYESGGGAYVDGGAGYDTLEIVWNGYTNWTLGSNIEQVLGGGGADQITANGNDRLGISYSGRGGDDTLSGSNGRDTLNGGAGDDRLYGGADYDTAVYGVTSWSATWTHNADGSWTVNAGAEGTDTLVGVERLQFTDRQVTLKAQAAMQGDYTGDGAGDVLIQNGAGAVVVGQYGAGGLLSYSQVGALGSEWTFKGSGDFHGDGTVDFLIQNSAGAVVLGSVEGGVATYAEIARLGPEWSFHGVGAFLGDGRAGFLIESTSGAVVVGELDDGGHIAYTALTALGSEWRFRATGDFLGEGHDQFIIQNTAGAVVVGDYQNGQTTFTQVALLGAEWSFLGAGDFRGDGRADFLLENANGALVLGELGAGGQAAYSEIGGLGPEWSFRGVTDLGGDGIDDFLMENTAGVVIAAQVAAGQAVYTPVSGLGADWVFHP